MNCNKIHQKMEDNSNELMLKIFNNYNNHENAILSSNSVFDLLRVLLIAADEKSLDKFDENVQNAINHISSSSLEKSMVVCLVPENEKYYIDANFIQRVKETFIGKNTHFMMKGIDEIENINKTAKIYLGECIFKKPFTNDIKYVFCSKNLFTAQWEYYFDSGYTERGNFFILPNKTKEVLMMKKSNIYIKSFISKFGKLQCNVYKFKYQQKHCMIVILPDNIYTGKDLNNHIIPHMSDIMKSFKNEKLLVKYDEVYMPKFKFEKEYDLNEIFDKIPNLDLFIKNDLNYSKMLLNKIVSAKNIDFKLNIEIENNEIGTKVMATSECYMYDSYHREPNKVIKLNRPFVYGIYDESNDKILYVGTLTDPSLN